MNGGCAQSSCAYGCQQNGNQGYTCGCPRGYRYIQSWLKNYTVTACYKRICTFYWIDPFYYLEWSDLLVLDLEVATALLWIIFETSYRLITKRNSQSFLSTYLVAVRMMITWSHLKAVLLAIWTRPIKEPKCVGVAHSKLKTWVNEKEK